MPETHIVADAQPAPALDAWMVCLKLVTAGATVALTAVFIVLTVSLYTRRDEYTPTAVHFTLANLFAAVYIASDTMVSVATIVANIETLQAAYRLAIGALPLAVAAYCCVYTCMTRDGWPSYTRVAFTYGTGLLGAALPWANSPYLVVASDQLTFTESNVFPDYGIAAGPLFAICVGVFAFISYRILRLAAAQKSTDILRLTAFGFAVFILCGVHDAVRELGLSILPIDTLALAGVLFQAAAFAVMVWHYSLTLGERRSHGVQLQHITDRANRDPLSSLYNRHYLEEYMTRAGPLARGGLLFVDLDHFKTINDDYGHLAGDRLIQTAAARMREATRERDIVCRWGGDEFVVLLALNADSGTAMPAIERLVRALDQTHIDGVDGLKLSASMGYAEFENGQWREALQRADAALYEAKRSGRRRVQIAC
ncbi:diguanylate cyclase/phosphodiesterase domain 1 [Salinisphaera shabanensis T35B1]|uniref:GGDEF domain-containing protein n=1 Tax=Salinisphaera shabanensis TaxID=180542 RepID=UPI00334219DA